MTLKTKKKEKPVNHENLIYDRAILKEMFAHKSPVMIADLMVREIIPNSGLVFDGPKKGILHPLFVEMVLALEAVYPIKFRKLKI